MEDPASHCLPGGIVKAYTDPLLRKIVQSPGLVLILSERNASYRQIFTDGRSLQKDPQPSFNGYSTGTWEGDILVVRTNGFRDGVWLDQKGSPLTESGRLTERFRRLNYGKLQIDITVDDPKAYTAQSEGVGPGPQQERKQRAIERLAKKHGLGHISITRSEITVLL